MFPAGFEPASSPRKGEMIDLTTPQERGGPLYCVHQLNFHGPTKVSLLVTPTARIELAAPARQAGMLPVHHAGIYAPGRI